MDSTILLQSQLQDSAVQPLDLNYQPKTPTVPEGVPAADSTSDKTARGVETVQEIYKPAETLATPEVELQTQMPSDPSQTDAQTTNDTFQLSTASVQKIVDQTETLTTLHPIASTPDPLTREADANEENFIEEVEKHHEHQ